MGQRHQVYVAYINDRKVPVMSAWHNQWCYGTLPLRHLYRILKYNAEAGDYSKLTGTDMFNNKQKVIESLLCTDYKEGFFSNYFDITDETKTEHGHDPDRGDNNDGITVIDLRGTRIKYCFMFLNDGDRITAYKPITAKQYVEAYYPENSKDYFKAGCPDLILKIERLGPDLLSLEEVSKLFPDNTTLMEVARVGKTKPIDLPLLMGALSSKVAREYFEQRLKEAA